MRISVQKPAKDSEGTFKDIKVEDPVDDKAVEDLYIGFNCTDIEHRRMRENLREKLCECSWIRVQTSIQCLEDDSLHSLMQILIWSM